MNGLKELSIDGRIATPDDGDWEQARQAWNLAADPHPTAVAYVDGADDVAKVIRFCADNDLRVLGQSTGHGAVAVGSLDDTVVIKTERLRGIEIDADASTARVEAGVLALEGALARRPVSTACARCPARHRTSGSPVTRSAAASAGWRGAMASPVTECAQSSS